MSTNIQTLTFSTPKQSDSERRKVEPAQIFVHGDGRRVRTDRRQRSIPVTVDRRTGEVRRSGADRREEYLRQADRQDQIGIS